LKEDGGVVVATEGSLGGRFSWSSWPLLVFSRPRPRSSRGCRGEMLMWE
jgi:hypothetical protein